MFGFLANPQNPFRFGSEANVACLCLAILDF